MKMVVNYQTKTLEVIKFGDTVENIFRSGDERISTKLYHYSNKQEWSKGLEAMEKAVAVAEGKKNVTYQTWREMIRCVFPERR
jgi:hypothetical protein